MQIAKIDTNSLGRSNPEPIHCESSSKVAASSMAKVVHDELELKSLVDIG